MATTQARMDEETAGLFYSFCEVLALLLGGVLIFFATYVVIRFTPSPYY